MEYVVIGGLSVDHVVNAGGERMSSQFGGNAAYGSAGLRLWTGPGRIGIVARMGEDYPREWIRKIQEAGIDIQGVRTVPGPHGLVGGFVYNSRGDRPDYIDLDESGEGYVPQDPQEVMRVQRAFGPDSGDIPAAWGEAKAIFLAPRLLEKQLDCARFFRRAGEGKRIVLDPMAFYMTMDRKAELRELFSTVDAVMPSETEMRALFGDLPPEEAARRLGELGAGIVVIKLGREGCLVYQRDNGPALRLPVCPVEARDPTGAGDSFCGGFLAGLAATGDPVLAAAWGTVSSSFVISGFGVDYTYPVTQGEARKRLSAFLTRCSQTIPELRERLHRAAPLLPPEYKTESEVFLQC